MSGLDLEVCQVYPDDIIFFSTDVSSHLVRLRAVFSRLRADGLTLKPSKCNLFRRRVGFLGHIVSEKAIETDAAKIQSSRGRSPLLSGRSEGSKDSVPTIVIS